jgi:hypothetical protein
MRNVTGEQLAQVDNPDPFASPVWRSPVYRTPEGVILLVQLVRLVAQVLWFIVRHPLLDLAAGLLVLTWIEAGWPGLVVLAVVVLAGLTVLRLAWPCWFAQLVSGPARNRWRWWFYRRHWQAVMTITRLAPAYRGRVVVPILGEVRVTGYTDVVSVRLVSGQSPADFAERAEGIAHGFRAHLCRVRSSAPGTVVLELVRRDTLAEPMPALAIPDVTGLRALPVGKREDGGLFTVRLAGTHLLIAGATGAGKGSYLWGLVRAMLPSRDSARCIGYLTKYLTKHVADCHHATTAAQQDHAQRLADALRYEPCSPTCANWLRYGIQPKNPREGLRPGHCTGKAHRREYLGYAGRRVLVSRKWSGKTLADHRADRKAWLLDTLGITEPDPSRYSWEPVTPGDPDHMPPAQRLLHVVADRQRWHAALSQARARASGQTGPNLSATGRPRDDIRKATAREARARGRAAHGGADVRRAGRHLAPDLLPLARGRHWPAVPQDPQRRAARLAQRIFRMARFTPRGCRMKSHKVRFWEIRPNKSSKRESWVVRWTVAGREKSATLERKAQADRYRSRLMQAADRGEAFDVDTGLPDSMAREVSTRTWYQHACAFADARWPKVAAKGRISLVEGLMAVTPVLVINKRGAPDPKVLRQAMRRWAFNPPRRDTPMPADVEAALRWLARSSVPVSALQEASTVSKALDACGRKLDGSAAAPEYYRRRRPHLAGADLARWLTFIPRIFREPRPRAASGDIWLHTIKPPDPA